MKAEKLIAKLDPDQRECFECCRHRHKDKMHHYRIKNNDIFICKEGQYCNQYFMKHTEGKAEIWL